MPEEGRQASAGSDVPEPGPGDPEDGAQDGWPGAADGTSLSPEHQAWLDDEANIWPDDSPWAWPSDEEIAREEAGRLGNGLGGAGLDTAGPDTAGPDTTGPDTAGPDTAPPAGDDPADAPAGPASGTAGGPAGGGMAGPGLAGGPRPGTELAAVAEAEASPELATVAPEPAGPPASRGRRALYAAGRQARNLLALALYTGLSLELFGHWILSRMSTAFMSAQPQDGSLFVWSFRWWNFATSHGLSVFYSRWDWAPSGVNLTWATTIPGPAYVLSWLTSAHGPFFSYNVTELAAPALGAWTAYLLCRRITGAFFPALLGGFFFGFSPSLIDELGQGHPSLTLVFLVPLAAYLIVWLLQGTIAPWLAALLLGLVLGAQLYIGTEVYAMMTLVGGLCALTGFAFGPAGRRKRLLRSVVPVIGAYALSGLLALPLLLAAFTSSRINKAVRFSTIEYGAQSGSDFLRYFTPGRFTLFWSGFGHQWGDNPWYLGIPLLVLIAAFLVTERRRRLTWLLFTALLVALVISIGDIIHLFGANILPWRLFAFLPVLSIAQPGRVLTYAYLLIAVLVAMWLAQAKRAALLPLRWLLALGAAVTILPNFPANVWATSVPTPAFFTTGAYRQFIEPGETVWLANAHPDRQLIWQTETNFYFKVPGGFFGGVPTGGPEPQPPDTGKEERLGIGQINPGTTIGELQDFLREHRIQAIVAANLPYPVIQELQATVGTLGQKMLGVRLFQLGSEFTQPASAQAGSGASGTPTGP